MKVRFTIYIAILSSWSTWSNAQIHENRRFETVVMTGDSLYHFGDIQLLQNIDRLYLYAYRASDDTWRMIPFQIDEVNPSVNDSIKYFIPEDSLAGLLDSDDELVFMASDVGDRADPHQWLENTDSTRLEIRLTDPLSNDEAYVYLYQSDFIDEPIPTYDFSYDAGNDRITSMNYELGFLEKSGSDINITGQVNDVLIKTGTMVDIFDRLKIRAFGSWLFFPIILNEENITGSSAYAKVGPVRVIRNMFGHFIYELLNINKKFTQTSLFYPWHGSFRLVDIPLGDAKEVGADVDELRISWDFSQDASGMKFYSGKNENGINIDGAPDPQVDLTLLPDQLNWTMGTGDQGTILNIFNVPALGDKIQLYYHESTTGSVGDKSRLSSDTGDKKSYGDNGFTLADNIEKYITTNTKFSAIYYNFFLPPNFDPAEASRMNEQLKTPLRSATELQQFRPTRIADLTDDIPGQYTLAQNYPNPFNGTTLISFSIPKRIRVSLRIYDALGRLVDQLVDNELEEGCHQYTWDGDSVSSSGIYFYELRTSEFKSTEKLLFIK